MMGSEQDTASRVHEHTSSRCPCRPMQRRTHQKSRNGCRNCKRRRVKVRCVLYSNISFFQPCRSRSSSWLS